jgi:CubicO group peptidase (beta-lactamase class C family)
MTGAASAASELPIDTLRTLDGIVGEARERTGVPGVAVGILHGSSEYVMGSGVTSVEHPLAVDADTLFQIGSITKTFTATAVLRLVEAGRLELDRPVKAYVPELRLADPQATATVTLRHLLTHTGGFEGDDFSDPGQGDDALARYVTGMAELRQLTPVGALFSYCNAGFCLAGRAVEQVTQQTYEAALRELVLAPLGLHRACLSPAEVMTHRFVVGHYLRDAAVVVARPWPLPRAMTAAGGITTSVSDLLTYARFALSDGVAASGSRLVRPETQALMHAPQATAGGMAEHVGLAWMLRHVGGVGVIEHSGGTNGQTCTLRLVPERAFAIGVLTNGDRGRLACEAVAAWAFKHFLGVEEAEPKVLALGADQLAPYVGRYEMRNDTVELVLQDAGLVALDPPFTGGRAEFLRDPAGHITWLRWGNRLAARRHRLGETDPGQPA